MEGLVGAFSLSPPPVLASSPWHHLLIIKWWSWGSQGFSVCECTPGLQAPASLMVLLCTGQQTALLHRHALSCGKEEPGLCCRAGRPRRWRLLFSPWISGTQTSIIQCFKTSEIFTFFFVFVFGLSPSSLIQDLNESPSIPRIV